MKIAFPAIVCVILFSPIPFGSVHLPWFLGGAITIGVALAVCSVSLRNTPLAQWLLALAALSFITPLVNLLFSPSYPLSGIQPVFVDRDRFATGMLTILSCAALALMVNSLSEREKKRVSSSIIISGLVVSGIALTHWISDNGALFWYFEPSVVSPSNRARWPFVNPNHLASFLIFPFFFSLNHVSVSFKKLADDVTKKKFRTNQTFVSLYIQSPALPSTLMRLIASAVIFTTILITQSRSVCLTVVIATLVGIFIHSFQREKHSRSAFLIATSIVVIALSFILLDRSEILRERLQYGLIAAKDDLRWAMYEQSLPILLAHPLFGVGLGGWERSFFGVADATFIGVNPQFLHSDSLQALIEFGGLGALATVFFLNSSLIATIKRVLNPLYSWEVLGLAAFILSFCFDFPLRIPAISWIGTIAAVLILRPAAEKSPS